jgi:hypothetical protein
MPIATRRISQGKQIAVIVAKDNFYYPGEISTDEVPRAQRYNVLAHPRQLWSLSLFVSLVFVYYFDLRVYLGKWSVTGLIRPARRNRAPAFPGYLGRKSVSGIGHISLPQRLDLAEYQLKYLADPIFILFNLHCLLNYNDPQYIPSFSRHTSPFSLADPKSW